MPNKNNNLIVSKSESWQMFNRISPKYDFVNRLMTFGMDIGWRKQLISFLPDGEHLSVLDLATGTADVPILLQKGSDRIDKVIGIDLAEDMVKVGQEKIRKEKLQHKIVLQKGDAQNISFDPNSFHAVTIAFGIRNVPDIQKALKEIHRVLKPNGRLLILECSTPNNPVIRAGHLFYLQHIIPLVGGLISGDNKAYKYLNQTVADFPSGYAFNEILIQCGFRNVKNIPLLYGASTIYIGEK